MTNVNISSLSLHSVYTKELSVTGVIFRRHFRAGDLVSYFSGQRTLSDLMFHDNQTDADKAEVGAYYFNLGGNCAEWWGCRLDDFVIDIPREFRSFVKSVSDYVSYDFRYNTIRGKYLCRFRTTLGHKANHRFVTNNVDYETVLHPVHGAIVCLVANTEIR